MKAKVTTAMFFFLTVFLFASLGACVNETTLTTTSILPTTTQTTTASVTTATTTYSTATPTTTTLITTSSTPIVGPEDTLTDDSESTIAFYRFNEGEGITITDETGNHNGVFVNGSDDIWVEGEYGAALNFTGTANQYVQVPNSSDFSPVNLTIELIIKMPAASKYRADHRLIFKDGQFDIHLWNPLSGNTGIYLMLRTESDQLWTDRIVLDGNIYDNEFHHIAMTYNGYTGKMDAYFDYVLESSTNIGPGRVLNMDNDLYIGGAYWAGEPQQCSSSIIDVVRITADYLAPADFLGSTSSVETADPGEPGNQMVLDYEFSAETASIVKDKYSRFPGSLVNITNYEQAYQTIDSAEVISFDGVNQYMTSSYADSLFYGDISVEMKIKLNPEDKSPGDYALVFKDLAYLINLWVNGDDCNVVFKFGVNDKFNTENFVTLDLFDGNFHHLAFVYVSETGIFTAYIDYSPVITLDFSTESNKAANFGLDTLFLGAAYWGDAIQRPSPVMFDFFKVYNHPVAVEDMTGYEPPSGLILDFDFSYIDEATVFDQSGNELDGEMINCTTDGEAVIINNARSSTDQGVRVLNNDYFKTQSLSVEMILKMDQTSMSGDHRLIFKDLVFDIHIWVDGETPKIIPMLVTSDHGWSDIAVIECLELFDGEYHHIGFIYNATEELFAFYIDYFEVASVSFSGGVSSNTNDLYIGAAFWADALQQGSDTAIKNVRLHNHAIEVNDFIGFDDREMFILDYDFNFIDGTQVIDQSSNDIHGEMINCTAADGILTVNNGRSSSDQGVMVPNNSLFATSSMTVEMVVKMDPTAMSGDHRLIFKDLVFDMHIWVDGSTPKLIPMLGTVSANWSDLTLYNCTEIFDGEFHHLAFTYDGSTGIWALFVDHAQVATGTIGGDVKVNTNALYIGAAYWAGAFQQGSDSQFKHVRIANYVVASENFIVYQNPA